MPPKVRIPLAKSGAAGRAAHLAGIGKVLEPRRSISRQAARSAGVAWPGSDQSGRMRHHAVEDTGGGEHAGQAGAGVRAGPDEVEPPHLLALVVRPEPGALGE